MSMNPIETTKKIKDDYMDYLKSIMAVKNDEIRKKLYQTLDNSVFVKGPYLEATPPYMTGSNLNNLIESGIASAQFKILESTIDLNRPLYLHQEKAFKKVELELRNIVVATGTGSGKTESFMYPVFNHLMKQIEEGTICDGVRALFLYPMNALANDQMKRLRELLKNYPEITFGRYTGETEEKESKALEKYRLKREKEIKSANYYARKGVDYNESDLNPLPNERISREAMRKSPPHILLTNYAMLEFLLIRPDDNVFFGGEYGIHWKFIVIDEAHSYKGANGTEIALLLRRLKERICLNKKGQIQCIATSATLGDASALPDLAKFASDIFDEHFEVSDIITSERVKRAIPNQMIKGSLDEYRKMLKMASVMEEAEYERYLYTKLIKDERVIHVLNILEYKPKNIEDVADSVFHDYSILSERQEGLVVLIQLGVRAKYDKDSMALLPARYHLFVKALEGVYLALYPEKQLFLDRKESIITHVGLKVPVFELSNCQHCGQEYLIGKEKENKLLPPSVDQKSDYFLLTNEQSENLEVLKNGDDEVLEISKVDKIEPYELCTACGHLIKANALRRINCCNCNDAGKIVKIYKLKSQKSDPNTCAACGSVSNSIIKRFMTANQPATYVVAQSLYSMIPPQKIEVRQSSSTSKVSNLFNKNMSIQRASHFDESGRKLLVFSDNRQEAAFFAAYMDGKYNQLIWRRLILNALRVNPDGYYLEDLINLIVKAADDNGLFPKEEQLTYGKKCTRAWQYLVKEFLVYERKQGLEGNGYVKFYPETKELLEDMRVGLWGLSNHETIDLICIFMDSFRVACATTLPESVSIEDDVFSPRNRAVFFRRQNEEKADSNFISFIPVGKSANKRSDFIKKLLKGLGIPDDSINEEVELKLDEMYGVFEALREYGFIKENLVNKSGVGYRIDYRKWKVAYIADSEVIYQCKKCKKKSNYNIRNICSEFRCDGELESIRANEYRSDPYYTKLYSDNKIIPMISEEHTAQLNKDEAGELQSRFENGQVNVLSCSTTFEMGVDVGQLEAIFLRNMPPETSNYIQRAGRAGRRTSSTAFSVTYAKRSSHDLNYFINPIAIISGNIKSPYIELKNDKIALRHVNSIVMAWFFRSHRSYFEGNVNAMIGMNEQNCIIQALKLVLEDRPNELIESIERVLPPYLYERLMIKEWGFVERLIGTDGSLTNAISQTLFDKSSLESIIEERQKKAGNKPIIQDDIVRHIQTICSTSAINYLAINSVIPKYGFPVDVVKLDILHNSKNAQSIDLSRDLKLAISEYAPGSEIIAAGNIWTSRYLNKVKGKEWPTYRYFECVSCGKTIIADERTALAEPDDEQVETCNCGSTMMPKKFIVPLFGFSTKRGEEPKTVGEKRPSRAYSTKIQFAGLDKLDQLQEQERIYRLIKMGDKTIKSMYSPQGRLVLLNKGIGKNGLFVCGWCGYAQSNNLNFVGHENRYGQKCGNSHYNHVALGHSFNSDILRLEFPEYVVKAQNDCDLWISLLYAILEGASDSLGISRSDINGCIDHTSYYPALILFDESAGGAGHVKQIANKLEYVLRAAYKRVFGDCKCGEETSCYGCLRGYHNQFDHERISRGMSKEYLEWFLFSNKEIVEVSYEIIDKMQYSQVEISRDLCKNELISTGNFADGWKEVLKILNLPEEEAYYNFALKCAENGNIKAPVIGYELISDEWGVSGFEAELAWQDYKLAIVKNNVNRVAFKEDGWLTYLIDEISIEQIAQIIK